MSLRLLFCFFMFQIATSLAVHSEILKNKNSLTQILINMAYDLLNNLPINEFVKKQKLYDKEWKYFYENTLNKKVKDFNRNIQLKEDISIAKEALVIKEEINKKIVEIIKREDQTLGDLLNHLLDKIHEINQVSVDNHII
ncbi:uncharacterized protein LOC126899621 [Daktulosphaira vitifoliae]|uniref:uncharacterized protein LOC126899621 n=1 Tax=Daktulosphaira vitifoliae TaxID=58002 RepID=UPI0021A9E89D|nr:uncharacterized protein LOC126899621 [Daktulosphaira vitifoliae]